jgi:chromate transporter
MQEQPTGNLPVYTLADITKYFLKLGTWGFGGPVALVA